MAGLEFTLFGGFRLSFDGERLPPIPSRASRSLLAHLVLHRGQPHTRDRLVATFWPDLPEPRGRRRLSHTLWQVQDALGELPTDHRYVDAVADTLAFNVDAPHEVDVEQFERRVERYRPGRVDRSAPGDLGRLEAVLELYAGVLLEGLDDPWVLPERERLAALHVDALGWMVELARGQGAFEQALVHARRLTHHDPLREDGHREVMRLCTLLGRTSEALRQYDRCRSVLAEELGTEPARATQQLADFVARQRGAPVRSPDTSPADTQPQLDRRLVGRDLERATLVEALERTLAGAGGVSMLEGGAGIGKTRLLAQVADDAQWRGFTVAHGVCEVGGDLPYLAIAEAVTPLLTPVRIAQLRPRVGDDWMAQVGRVVPRLARAGSASAARGLPTDAADQMREAFVRLLTGMADIEPTLLVIEDVHDADAETLQVLQWLAGRLDSRRLHLVLAYRGTEARAREQVWSVLRSIDMTAVPDRVMLGPLTAFGTAELVREVLGGDTAPALAARIHDETGGNPLFVLETVRAVRDQGGIGPDGGEDLPLPGSIRDVTVARVQQLSPTVREVLAVAAVQARAVDLDVLSHVTASQDQPAVTGDAVAELLRGGLLVEESDGYGFRHELLRRIVVDELEDGVRVDLHARVADALEVYRPDRIEDVARHRDAAGQAVEAVAAWWAAAERAVALHAYETARGHLARAVELHRRRPVAVEVRQRLLTAYEDVLSVLAAYEEQAVVLHELTELAGTTGGAAADVARRKAWLAAHTDQYEVAEAMAATAVDLAEDTAARAAGLTVMGTGRSWRGDHESAVVALTDAVEAHPDAGGRAQARVALGSSLRSLGRFDDAVEVLRDAVSAYGEADDVHGEARALGALAAVRMEQGAVTEAVAGYESALEQCRRIGYRHGEGVTLVNLGNALYVGNDVMGALEHYDAAAEVFTSIGNARGRATVQMNAAIVRHEVLGDDPRARDDAHAALSWFAGTGDGRAIATCQHTLASIHLRDGDVAAARRRLDQAWPETTNDPLTAAQLAQLAAAVVVAEGDLDEAERLLTHAMELAQATGRSGLVVRVRADRARVRLRAGDLDGADRDSRAALAGLDDAVERPSVVWWTRHVVATALGADDADTALTRAVDRLEASMSGVPAGVRERADSVVPEHAAILSAREASRPRRSTIRVAGADVPIGRPLAPDDLIEVVIELDHEGADAGDPATRRRVLSDIVHQARKQGGAPTVDDLATVLSVSASTVRRDLTALREGGVHVPTRGSRAS